jgi:hypothetical protein
MPLPSKKARRVAATPASRVLQTSNNNRSSGSRTAPGGTTAIKPEDRPSIDSILRVGVGVGVSQSKKTRGDLECSSSESSSESAYDVDRSSESAYDVDRTSSSEGAALLALASLLASRHALATEMSQHQHMESKHVEIFEDLGTRENDSNSRDAAFLKVQETDCEA